MASRQCSVTTKEMKAELVCFGYLRDPSSRRMIVPQDIVTTLCVRYYVQRIDYFKEHYGSKIDTEHNIFGVEEGKHDKHITYTVSQCGWSRGRHEMSINVINHNYRHFGLSIGILTNPDITVGGQWMFDSKEAGCSYQFYFGCLEDPNASGIYEMRNGKSTCLEEKRVHETETGYDAMNGADISMLVDCDEWTIRFLYNQQQIGKTLDIQPAEAYYAAIVYNTDHFPLSTTSCKYSLTRHTRNVLKL